MREPTGASVLMTHESVIATDSWLHLEASILASNTNYTETLHSNVVGVKTATQNLSLKERDNSSEKRSC